LEISLPYSFHNAAKRGTCFSFSFLRQFPINPTQIHLAALEGSLVLWLASYPRSGNTFFRVILSEVYGIESSEFHDPAAQAVDRTYLNYSVVKTHLLPDELVPADPSIPAVYIVRDGRDAVVSAARQHCNLIDPGADFATILKAAILAQEGTFFGGWSRHVRLWSKRAAIVLRFEDLIADPIGTAEAIRAIYPLPEPRPERLPEFGDLRERKFDFGTGSEVMDSSHFRQNFFRRGKVGAWKDEMPLLHRMLFYRHHGWMLLKMGFAEPPMLRRPNSRAA
jgi:hypothetical protein